MIAKRIKKSGKSSFNALSRYIRDLKAQGAKVRECWATNCADPDDIELAEIQIEATQALNTRSKIDKTYHLVVSLAPGESLSEKQWKKVEAHFCKVIGLEDHQRIAAVHTDTDSQHIHLAISKIHPEKFTAIEPYYDKYKLQDACRELEKFFGLKLGISEEKGLARQDIEAFRKIESFATYIQENAKDPLKAALSQETKSWAMLQEELGKLNLEMRQRGDGLVISHREKKLFVKASSIGREFSKKSLESKLGPFQESLWQGPPQKSYSPEPSEKSLASARLFAEYQSERGFRDSARAELRSEDKQRLQAKLDEIRDRYAERRHEIKRDTIIAKGRKREVYQRLSQHMKEEISEVYKEDKERREKIRADLPYKPWREWIYEKASGGDEASLSILRAQNPSAKKVTDGIEVFKGELNHQMFEGIPRSVLRDGTIEYRLSEGSFFDFGDQIVVKSESEKVLEIARQCAEAKFGSSKALTQESLGAHKQKTKVQQKEKGQSL